MRYLLPLASLALVLCYPTPGQALKLYKVTRPDGTVMYQTDLPEKGTAVRIEEKHINPNANVVPIEQFPMDGDYTVPEGAAGSIRPSGPAARTKVVPLPKEGAGNPAAPPAASGAAGGR